jgi:hypothetical protein
MSRAKRLPTRCETKSDEKKCEKDGKNKMKSHFKAVSGGVCTNIFLLALRAHEYVCV